MPVRPLFALLFLAIFTLISSNSFAAIPIKDQKQQSRVPQWLQQLNNAASPENRIAVQTAVLPEQGTEKRTDSGVYGILALVSGLLGIFPAAIVLGVIGLEKHRRYRELALTGLILGILTLIALLILIGFVFVFFGPIV